MTGDEAQFLEALYGGAADPAEFERALQIIAQQMRCQSAALLSLNVRSPAADMAVSVGLFDDAARGRYLKDFAGIDPAPAAFARMPLGTASTTDRILADHERKHGAFANEFYYPLGLAETLGGNLRSDNGCFELLGLHRGPDRPAFEDTELAMVERLMPHISRALQLRRAFLRLEVKATGLQNALDRLHAGVALLDTAGTASYVNHALQLIAQRRDGISLNRAGRPVPANAEARIRFDALFAAAARGGSGGTMVVPRSTGVRPYSVLVSPSPTTVADSLLPRAGSRQVLVVVHDPASDPVENYETLQIALGLPPGAARLVAALASDGDLKSFAEREGITIHTARFHLRIALERTGARTQAELVRLAVRLLRDFGLEGNNGGSREQP
jgi:hypothetical protein